MSPEDGQKLKMFGSILQEEMDARGWTTRDVVTHMPAVAADSEAWGLRVLELDMTLAVAETADEHVIVPDETLRDLDEAFGVSDGFFTRVLRGEIR